MNNIDYDKKYMLIAIEEAKKGMYKTHPNPLVGAVLVKNNKILSKGYHKKFRDKHAEQDAIDKAKESVKGSTLYVTLEPCHHHGNTPPCVDAIMQNKIKRVVIASKDPNPLINGKSIMKLQENGIEVTLGVCSHESNELNKAFFYKYRNNKPYIRAKFGTSLDGKIANVRNQSKWITSKKSRDYVQYMRADVNAILTTSNTILSDNPYMNVRDKNLLKLIKDQPALIVLDTKLRIPKNANIFKTDRLVILLTSIEMVKKNDVSIYGKNVVLKYMETSQNKININHIYQVARDYGLDDILVESGMKLASSLIEEDAIDELVLFIAPKILGHRSLRFSGMEPVKNLKHKKKYKINTIRQYDTDLYINMRRG